MKKHNFWHWPCGGAFTRSRAAMGSALVGVALLLFGCSAIEQQPPPRQYFPEYSASIPRSLSAVDATIRVEPFCAARTYDTTDMIYRPKPFQRDAYVYSRWSARPGSMIADSIVRDLVASGLFKAVFTSCDVERADYILRGNVEEFLETYGDEGSAAILTVFATLENAEIKNSAGAVVFQKKYSLRAPVRGKNAEGFASGMGAAMEQFSNLLIADIVKAVRR